MSETRTLADWLAHCAAMHPKTMDLSLERTVQVAQRLGIAFKVPVITVAGTNGKGSTCAMLESILGQAGYKTGVYTSPHLVHFEERMRLLGEAAPATTGAGAARAATSAVTVHFPAAGVFRPYSSFHFGSFQSVR